MTYNSQSKLPLPIKALGMDFLTSKSSQTHVVLEFQTSSNPLRVFLSRQQLQELASKARVAATKLT